MSLSLSVSIIPYSLGVHIRHQYKKYRSRASCTIHCKPSFRLSPVIALHRKIIHLWVCMASSFSPFCRARQLIWVGRDHQSRHTCRISSSLILPSMSILLQKTNKLAPIKRLEIRSARVAAQTSILPLQAAGQTVLSDSHQVAYDQWHPQPKSGRRSSQSNFSNRIGVFSGPPHPLGGKGQQLKSLLWRLENEQMFSL
jgi:hypothetical protein